MLKRFKTAMQRLVQEGNPSVIIQMMTRHSSNKDSQQYGCGALCNLAASHAENQTRIASAGGIEAVVKAMQTHPQCVVVALRALRILAASHAENQTRIASAGGIEAVVKAMQTHPQSVEVQGAGCGALKLRMLELTMKLRIQR